VAEGGVDAAESVPAGGIDGMLIAMGGGVRVPESVIDGGGGEWR